MRLTSLSASRIKTFKLCHWKYFMIYDLGIDLGTNWGAMHGTVIHAVLEDYAKGDRDWQKLLLDQYLHYKPLQFAKQKEYDDVKKTCQTCPLYKDKMCTLEGVPANFTRGCGLRLWNKSVKLLETYFDADGSVYDKPVVGIEKKFHLEFVPGKFVTGFIDFIYRDGDSTIHMIDYKTSKKWEKSQNYNAIKQDIQARIYALAMREMFPDDEIQLLTFYFFNNRPITVFYSEYEIEQTRQLLSDIWDKIQAIDDPKRLRDGFSFLPRECQYICDEQICQQEWKKYKGEQ